MCIICDNVYCYVIAIVFVWEALNGTIALLCCHVSMKLDVGLTKLWVINTEADVYLCVNPYTFIFNHLKLCFATATHNFKSLRTLTYAQSDWKHHVSIYKYEFNPETAFLICHGLAILIMKLMFSASNLRTPAHILCIWNQRNNSITVDSWIRIYSALRASYIRIYESIELRFFSLS